MSESGDPESDSRLFRTPLSAGMLMGAVAGGISAVFSYFFIRNGTEHFDRGLYFFAVACMNLACFATPLLVIGNRTPVWLWMRYALINSGAYYYIRLNMPPWLAHTLHLSSSLGSIFGVLLIVQEIGIAIFCLLLRSMYEHKPPLMTMLLYAQPHTILGVVFYVLRYGVGSQNPDTDAFSLMAAMILSVGGMALMSVPFEREWRKARAARIAAGTTPNPSQVA